MHLLNHYKEVHYIQFGDRILNVSSHKKNEIKTRQVLRIPDDKMLKPQKKCTNMAEKVSPSGQNKLNVGVSWAQVVNDRVPVIPTIATEVQVVLHAKTKHPTLK